MIRAMNVTQNHDSHIHWQKIRPHIRPAASLLERLQDVIGLASGIGIMVT